MDDLPFHEKSRYNNLPWDDLTVGKLGVSPMEGGQKISGDLRSLVIFWLVGAPNGPPHGPQWFQMDDLAFHEKSRYNDLLWDDLTVGKLGVCCMEGGQRNI